MSEGKMLQQAETQNPNEKMQQQAVSLELQDEQVQAAATDAIKNIEVNQHFVEQQYRASAYSVLAALLRGVPAQEILDHVAEFATINSENVEEDELLLSMTSLGLAAQTSNVSDVDDEYHVLFVGLGKGELVPYGSWYLTGFLMEQPLSILRDDLKTLGYERDENVVEPEDHVAALCEMMSLLITENIPAEDTKSDPENRLGTSDKSIGTIDKDTTQVIFFEKHIIPWMGRFFDDLSQAESAVFYRAVGRFGTAFINFEKLYLNVS